MGALIISGSRAWRFGLLRGFVKILLRQFTVTVAVKSVEERRRAFEFCSRDASIHRGTLTSTDDFPGNSAWAARVSTRRLRLPVGRIHQSETARGGSDGFTFVRRRGLEISVEEAVHERLQFHTAKSIAVPRARERMEANSHAGGLQRLVQ